MDTKSQNDCHVFISRVGNWGISFPNNLLALKQGFLYLVTKLILGWNIWHLLASVEMKLFFFFTSKRYLRVLLLDLDWLYFGKILQAIPLGMGWYQAMSWFRYNLRLQVNFSHSSNILRAIMFRHLIF